MAKNGGRILVFLGSQKVACVLFLLLFWLTFWGTIAQREMSIYDVQVRFFESIFVVYWVGSVPIPMLGGYLLLGVLFFNLLVGGILRVRYNKRTVGIVIAHMGVLLLLVGSFIEFKQKTAGHMLLFPGDESEEFVSSDRWEVVLEGRTSDGKLREYVVPEKHFKDLSAGDSTRYTHADLPFDLVLTNFARNAVVRGLRPGEHPRLSAEGMVLMPMDDVGPDEGTNRPGLLAVFEPEGGDKEARRGAILLGFAPYPFSTEFDGRRWSLELRRESWDLPFKIRLTKFVHKKHAATSMAKEYSSYVTKIEPDPNSPGQFTSEEHHITMNEPLRHAGYTFYQSSWGPQDAGPNDPIFSQFSVVNNPTDDWPMITCWIIFVGLLIHFSLMLGRYLTAESNRRVRAEGGA